MMKNLESEELNIKIKENNPTLFELFSKKGKNAYFPKLGIVNQTKEAKGKDVNATIGMALNEENELMLNESAKSLVDEKLSKSFSYASSYGLPELRELWKSEIKKKNPSIKEEFSEPVVTNGLTHALSVSKELFFDEGDKLIIPNLYWENYDLIFEKNTSTKFLEFNLFKENKFDLESFKQVFESSNKEKKIILLNFPNNPCGYTITESEAEEIKEFLLKKAESGEKIIVIIDDAYFGLVYEEGILKESIFSKLYNLHENILAVKIDGASKEEFAWGLREGFLTFGVKNANQELYHALEAKSAGLIRASISNASNLSQKIILESIKNDSHENEKKEKCELLKERYAIVKKELENKEYKNYFTAFPFNSGYFMCIKLKEGINGEELRKTLLEKYSLGVISNKDIIRIAFSSVPKNKIPFIFSSISEATQVMTKNG